MAKKTKYYVVWVGHTPGVYGSWAECQAQVKGYPDARYKAYGSKSEAEDAFAGGFEYRTASPRKGATRDLADLPVERNSISVDAACSGNPGIMEYRGVSTMTREEIFRQGPFEDGTNNIGEFLALVHALAMLQKQGDHESAIYSDSRTAMSWVRKKKANTKLSQTRRNSQLFELIRRAEAWLQNNTYRNRILKWDTAEWGEIPADFGRK